MMVVKDKECLVLPMRYRNVAPVHSIRKWLVSIRPVDHVIFIYQIIPNIYCLFMRTYYEISITWETKQTEPQIIQWMPFILNSTHDWCHNRKCTSDASGWTDVGGANQNVSNVFISYPLIDYVFIECLVVWMACPGSYMVRGWSQFVDDHVIYTSMK
jgi:hypothetical protein